MECSEIFMTTAWVTTQNIRPVAYVLSPYALWCAVSLTHMRLKEDRYPCSAIFDGSN